MYARLGLAKPTTVARGSDRADPSKLDNARGGEPNVVIDCIGGKLALHG